MANTNGIFEEEVKRMIQTFIIDNFLFGKLDKMPADNDSFIESGVIDSTGILELIQFIEGKYGIKIEDSELTPGNFDSLNNVSAFIVKKDANKTKADASKE